MDNLAIDTLKDWLTDSFGAVHVEQRTDGTYHASLPNIFSQTAKVESDLLARIQLLSIEADGDTEEKALCNLKEYAFDAAFAGVFSSAFSDPNYVPNDRLSARFFGFTEDNKFLHRLKLKEGQAADTVPQGQYLDLVSSNTPRHDHEDIKLFDLEVVVLDTLKKTVEVLAFDKTHQHIYVPENE